MLPLLLAGLLFLGGCSADPLPRGRDIARLELARTISLDAGAEGDIRVGSLAKAPGEEGEALIRTGEGRSLSEALGQLERDTEGNFFPGHVEQYLLGADLARRGREAWADHLLREPSLRLSTGLYLTEGSAADVLKAEELSDALKSLERNRRDIAASRSFGTGEVLGRQLDTGWALLPLLEAGEEGPILTRYGVLGADGTLFYINEEQSRMAELLEGQTGRERILLAGASLRLTAARVDYDPIWAGSELAGVRVRIRAKADLEELTGPFSQEAAEAALGELLRRRAVDLLQLSQSRGADFLDLEKRLGLAAPGDWDRIQRLWDGAFPALDWQVEVTAEIDRRGERSVAR